MRHCPMYNRLRIRRCARWPHQVLNLESQNYFFSRPCLIGNVGRVTAFQDLSNFNITLAFTTMDQIGIEIQRNASAICSPLMCLY